MPTSGSPLRRMRLAMGTPYARLAAAFGLAVSAWPLAATAPWDGARDRGAVFTTHATADQRSPGASERAAAVAPPPPVYRAAALPGDLEDSFKVKKFKLDSKSGNYLSPRVAGKTPNEDLVPILINNRYAKDLRGNPVFLRRSLRDLLIAADLVMFAKVQKHIVVNYGFRSNALQAELYGKLAGKGAVAPAGTSFHETGLAVDISNWREAQSFLIDAGFVGGCYGIEEDLVHYSIGEVTKASNAAVFKRCTLREIPEHIVNGLKKAGHVGDLFKR
jgi:hypothetical protein